MMRHILLWTSCLLAAGSTGLAAVDACARIADDAERLACYDALEAGAAPAERTFLERHWDLFGDGGTFRAWDHRPTYVLPARWTDDANAEPFEDAAGAGSFEPPDVQSTEAKFQISFKTKLVNGLFGGPGALWVGYTQQSHFQVYNESESRPFRETDFQPELMAIFPLRRSWGGWSWRMVGAGIVHESNGRSEPLSRSWDRVYAIAGIERGDWVIHLRPWARIDSRDVEDDDNPKITDRIGRMDITAQWTPRRQAVTLRARTNLDTSGHKGSLEANWFFPIGDRVRGQLQAFSGYGESLIDFDHRQTTVGLGILLFDPF